MNTESGIRAPRACDVRSATGLVRQVPIGDVMVFDASSAVPVGIGITITVFFAAVSCRRTNVLLAIVFGLTPLSAFQAAVRADGDWDRAICGQRGRRCLSLKFGADQLAAQRCDVAVADGLLGSGSRVHAHVEAGSRREGDDLRAVLASRWPARCRMGA